MDVLISHHDQSDKGPGFVLGNAGAEILLTKETDAEKAIAMVARDFGLHVITDIDPVQTKKKNAVRD
jgi:hypothetical protein